MMLLGLLVASSVGASSQDIHLHPAEVSDEELFASLDLDRPGLEAVKSCVAAGDYAGAAEAWTTYWRQRKTPILHFDREAWPATIRRDYPALGQAMVAMADRIAAGELKCATVALPVSGREIDWLSNPTKDTNYVDLTGSWFYMSSPGRAYLLTGDERYAEAFAWVFESWYDHQSAILDFKGNLDLNTIYQAYYPGIRTRVLCDNYYCLARSPALTPGIHVKLMKQILAASSWLYADNAVYKVGNQQVAAVMGMAVAGMLLPEFRQSRAWTERGVQRMREHLQQDFFPDGGHRELCTQYHKTCLRDLCYVALVAQRNGLASFYDSDDPSHEAFERAYDWLVRIVMPRGLTPPIHSAVFSNDYAVHLQTAGEQFSRPDFLWLAGRVWDKGRVPSQKSPFSLANWIVSSPLGFEGPKPARPKRLSDHLPDSGLAIMRSGWRPSDRYLILQYGWPNTGHAYPGALHFCLAMNGEVIATSPGSPLSYALPSYRYCHSTPSHNVVSIDGASYSGKNRIVPGGTLHKYADLGDVWYVRASHEGYREQFGAIHERQVLAIKRGPIIIRDTITGGAGHAAQWNLHTPLQVEPSGPGRVILTGHKQYTLCLADPDTLSVPETEMHWSVVPPDLCQPTDCGKEVPAITFERSISENGAEFVAAIIEGQGSIERRSEASFRVTAGRKTYVVSFAGPGAMSPECTVKFGRPDARTIATK
jgi:hypothetical protein